MLYILSLAGISGSATNSNAYKQQNQPLGTFAKQREALCALHEERAAREIDNQTHGDQNMPEKPRFARYL